MWAGEAAGAAAGAAVVDEELGVEADELPEGDGGGGDLLETKGGGRREREGGREGGGRERERADEKKERRRGSRRRGVPSALFQSRSFSIAFQLLTPVMNLIMSRTGSFENILSSILRDG